MSERRCTVRKHVKERGEAFCDCGAVMVGPTAGGNALVVTLIDTVQQDALTRITSTTGDLGSPPKSGSEGGRG